MLLPEVTGGHHGRRPPEHSKPREVGNQVADNVSATIPRPLLGTEEAVLDDKGRVLVSKKKRERLGETFTLILGKVGCLMMVPDLSEDQGEGLAEPLALLLAHKHAALIVEDSLFGAE